MVLPIQILNPLFSFEMAFFFFKILKTQFFLKKKDFYLMD